MACSQTIINAMLGQTEGFCECYFLDGKAMHYTPNGAGGFSWIPAGCEGWIATPGQAPQVFYAYGAWYTDEGSSQITAFLNGDQCQGLIFGDDPGLPTVTCCDEEEPTTTTTIAPTTTTTTPGYVGLCYYSASGDYNCATDTWDISVGTIFGCYLPGNPEGWVFDHSENGHCYYNWFGYSEEECWGPNQGSDCPPTITAPDPPPDHFDCECPSSTSTTTISPTTTTTTEAPCVVCQQTIVNALLGKTTPFCECYSYGGYEMHYTPNGAGGSGPGPFYEGWVPAGGWQMGKPEIFCFMGTWYLCDPADGYPSPTSFVNGNDGCGGINFGGAQVLCCDVCPTTTTTSAPTTTTTSHPEGPTTPAPSSTTTTTFAPPATTTTGPCAVHPMDWSQIGLNAVEVTYDFDKNTTELTVANTFFMLEGWSEIKRRLEEGQLSQRELDLSERIIDCQIVVGSQTPGTTVTVEPVWTTTSTTTVAPTTTTTTGSGTPPPEPTTTTTTFTGTTTTTTVCNVCDPPLQHIYHVTLCGLGGTFEPFNGDHLVYNYNGSCLWTSDGSGSLQAPITLQWAVTEWQVHIWTGVGSSCVKKWKFSELTGCLPAGVYAEVFCYDMTCPDHTSCAESAGATCEVGDTAGTCPTTTTTTASCEDCRGLAGTCWSVDFQGGSCLNTGPGPEMFLAWVGAVLNFGHWYCTWTDDAPPIKGKLTFHDSFGWRIEGLRTSPSCIETYYKVSGRYNPCDPTGSYTEVLHGHPAVVAAIACPTTTTTTEAPCCEEPGPPPDSAWTPQPTYATLHDACLACPMSAYSVTWLSVLYGYECLPSCQMELDWVDDDGCHWIGTGTSGDTSVVFTVNNPDESFCRYVLLDVPTPIFDVVSCGSTTSTTTTTFTGTTTTTTKAPTTTTTIAPTTTTTTEAPPTDCNPWCSPPLNATYTVTLNGLSGAFAAYNGAHQVTFGGGCTWYDGVDPIDLYWDSGSGRWYVGLPVGYQCSRRWYQTNELNCDPTGGYSIDWCTDAGCSGSCGVPGSGTCVVS